MFCDSNSNTLTTAAITASLAAVRVQRPTNVYVRVRMYDRVEISRCLCRCFTRFGSSDCYSSFQPTVSQSMPSQLPSLLLLLRTVICVSGIGAICGGMVYDSPCTAARAASACCLLQQPRAACCMQWSGVRFKLYEFMHVSCFQDVRICTACAVRQLVRSCQFDWSSDWPTQTNADKKIWSTST